MARTQNTFLPVIFLALTASAASTKDLGVQGATFEVKEQSLLEVIYERLRALASTNKLAEHQKEIQGRVKSSIENPRSIEGITTADSYSSRTYDPSIMVDEDIKDHKGNYIARKGTHVNPLDYQSFGKPLILIQGDDGAQVSWALKQDAKVVLVSGKPLALARDHRKMFYFDQGSILSNKFSIKAVPARISQQDKMLLIEELTIEGSHQ
jgi:conjugal transfer pilus assembly protein TraW